MRSKSFCILILACAVLALPAIAQERIVFEDNFGAPGFQVVSQSQAGVELTYSVPYIEFAKIQVGDRSRVKPLLPGAILGNNQGAPDLQGVSRFIAFPQGAAVSVEVLKSRSRVIEGIDIVPAPPLPRVNDDSPPVYEEDPAIYGTDAPYPAEPVLLSAPLKIRGVDVVHLGVTPFTYNPVRKVLTVFSDFRIRVNFHGGNGQFGDDAYRNRYFEPLLRQHLFNYASLSPMNFDHRHAGARAGECEYIIFSPDKTEFLDWAETIKKFRVKQGVSTEVVNIASIGGSASGIENYINDAYKNWTLKPVAVLMLGDLPDVPVFTWGGYCLSDNIYADYDGDDLPEINVARLTARDNADLDLMISKFINYETSPPTNPSFYDEPIIAGGWQSDRWFILCCEVCWGYHKHVGGKNPVREYAGYGSGAPTYWSTNPNTYMIENYFGPSGLGYIPATPSHLTDWGGNATRINNDINSGAFYLLHRDHGGETGWSEPYYNISHLSGLYNDDLCFVMSINCLTGKYDHSPECFAEAFHRMDHGALGVIAASNISYSFVNDTYVWGMHDSMWPDFDPGYGGSTGDNMLMPGFANASGKLYLDDSSWPYNPSNKDETYHLFHMHGDAFSVLYTEVPQNLTVSHGNSIDNVATSFDVTADAGALIALSAHDKVLGTAESQGGVTTVTINPPMNPGIMYVTVTKPNHYRYEGQVVIQIGGALAIFPLDTPPKHCLPGPPTDVTLMIVDGQQTYVPGSGKVYYRFDSADPYSTGSFTPLGGDLYLATVPGASPQSTPEFYFSAQGSGGTTVYSPPDAPATVYSMTVDPLLEVLFEDDFEADTGWTVESQSIVTGEWERADPSATSAQPGDDHSADGTKCWVTGRLGGSVGDDDVDGGPTRLISPALDLSSSSDWDLGFYLWFHHTDYGNQWPMQIHLSNNDGASWTLAETVNHSPGWNFKTIKVSDHVTPTDKVKIRFSASDNPNDDIVEGLVDDFSIQRYNDDANLWASAYSISAAAGIDMSFYMNGKPGNAGRNYLLLGTLSGTSPGFPLPGGHVVPLNWDYFTDYIVQNLASPVFQNFLGTLDSAGRADAAFNSFGVMDPGLIGQTMHYVFVLDKPWDFTSNALAVEIVP